MTQRGCIFTDFIPASKNNPKYGAAGGLKAHVMHHLLLLSHKVSAPINLNPGGVSSTNNKTA